MCTLQCGIHVPSIYCEVHITRTVGYTYTVICGTCTPQYKVRVSHNMGYVYPTVYLPHSTSYVYLTVQGTCIPMDFVHVHVHTCTYYGVHVSHSTDYTVQGTHTCTCTSQYLIHACHSMGYTTYVSRAHVPHNTGHVYHCIVRYTYPVLGICVLCRYMYPKVQGT